MRRPRVREYLVELSHLRSLEQGRLQGPPLPPPGQEGEETDADAARVFGFYKRNMNVDMDCLLFRYGGLVGRKLLRRIYPREIV